MNRNLLTLNQLFYQALSNHSEKIAIVFQELKWTYGDLLKSGNRVARSLMNYGVMPNTPVALLMSNSIEFIQSDIGLMFAGGTKIPLNDMLGENEIKYILQDSKAEVAIVGPNFIGILENIRDELPNLKTVIAVVDNEECPNEMITWENFQAQESEERVYVNVHPQNIALIAYTGGTTGLPKGVVHSQENITINLYSHIIELEMQDDETVLLMSPLAHTGGIVLHTGLLKGATNFVVKGFDPKMVVDSIHNYKITFLFMVPTMIYRVLDEIKYSKYYYDLSSIRTILYGAAPITEQRLKQGLEVFGQVFTQLYGQTEAPNFITRLKKSDHFIDDSNNKRLRSCGQPVLMSQVKIVDENGKEVPDGEVGEIIAKTPYNMIEYLNQLEKTKETIKDDWLFTGDIGTKDEGGYIYLLDRKKDMVISGGMNVYTTEVENIIQTHPAVSQVVVIGVPHADWGEAVLAMVVLKLNQSISEEEIMEYCKRNLSKYKRPKEVKFLEHLPTTVYGKIDKKVLRNPYWQSMGRNI